MGNISTPILNLKSLEIDESGESGTNIHFSGTSPGIINAILRLIKIAGNTDMRMNASYLELRSGGLAGQKSWFVPTGSLSSIQGGYTKDIFAIVFAMLLFVGGIVGLFFPFAGFTFTASWLFAIILILAYIFTKTMYIEIESGGGMTAIIKFKGSIDLSRVEYALAIMQALIAKAQYSGEVRVMGKLTEVVIPAEQETVNNSEESEQVVAATAAQTHVDEHGNTLMWNGTEWVATETQQD